MRLDHLTIYHGILRDPLINAFSRLHAGKADTDFLRLLYADGSEGAFAERIARAVLSDENIFSRSCAAGVGVSELVRTAVANDLSLIGRALSLRPRGFLIGTTPTLFKGWDKHAAERLADYYRQNGYGRFLFCSSFRYLDGELVPVSAPSAVTMDDLKGYISEKAQVTDNIENFVSGLPYADMLLYGDRGTGKSSTVHAAVNLFADKKLRLVEISKENILSLPALKTKLAAIPMKFVVFIDDFSLRESDDRVSTLKAALQGSMEGHVGNVMIVATSNRRHIVEENFDSRMNSVHMGDSEEELLSLSDRFGITVLFAAVNKEEYLRIVADLAADTGLTTPQQTLFALAERWALLRGGRSPRRARQFIDYVFACEQKKSTPEF